MGDTVENLRKLSKEFYDQYRILQDKITQLVEVPLAKSLIGKCFKYANSYSINEKWFMYVKVIDYKKTNLTLEIFQEDFYGKIEFVYDKHGYVTQFQGGNYVPITEKEYYREQKKLIDKLNRRHKRSTKK